MSLRVFKNDVVDWVVAADVADARAVWEEHTGDPYDADAHAEWLQLPDAEIIAINTDDAHVEKTATEWAAENGRGFLCSTEY